MRYLILAVMAATAGCGAGTHPYAVGRTGQAVTLAAPGDAARRHAASCAEARAREGGALRNAALAAVVAVAGSAMALAYAEPAGTRVGTAAGSEPADAQPTTGSSPTPEPGARSAARGERRRRDEMPETGARRQHDPPPEEPSSRDREPRDWGRRTGVTLAVGATVALLATAVRHALERAASDVAADFAFAGDGWIRADVAGTTRDLFVPNHEFADLAGGCDDADWRLVDRRAAWLQPWLATVEIARGTTGESRPDVARDLATWHRSLHEETWLGAAGTIPGWVASTEAVQAVAEVYDAVGGNVDGRGAFLGILDWCVRHGALSPGEAATMVDSRDRRVMEIRTRFLTASEEMRRTEHFVVRGIAHQRTGNYGERIAAAILQEEDVTTQIAVEALTFTGKLPAQLTGYPPALQTYVDVRSVLMRWRSKSLVWPDHVDAHL